MHGPERNARVYSFTMAGLARYGWGEAGLGGGGFSTPGCVRPSQWPTGLAVGLGLRGLPLPRLSVSPGLGFTPWGHWVPCSPPPGGIRPLLR
jgi:hypothetical protein